MDGSSEKARLTEICHALPEGRMALVCKAPPGENAAPKQLAGTHFDKQP